MIGMSREPWLLMSVPDMIPQEEEGKESKFIFFERISVYNNLLLLSTIIMSVTF